AFRSAGIAARVHERDSLGIRELQLGFVGIEETNFREFTRRGVAHGDDRLTKSTLVVDGVIQRVEDVSGIGSDVDDLCVASSGTGPFDVNVGFGQVIIDTRGDAVHEDVPKVGCVAGGNDVATDSATDRGKGEVLAEVRQIGLENPGLANYSQLLARAVDAGPV